VGDPWASSARRPAASRICRAYAADKRPLVPFRQRTRSVPSSGPSRLDGVSPAGPQHADDGMAGCVVGAGPHPAPTAGRPWVRWSGPRDGGGPPRGPGGQASCRRSRHPGRPASVSDSRLNSDLRGRSRKSVWVDQNLQLEAARTPDDGSSTAVWRAAVRPHAGLMESLATARTTPRRAGDRRALRFDSRREARDPAPRRSRRTDDDRGPRFDRDRQAGDRGRSP
jgi:hypothetical protein